MKLLLDECVTKYLKPEFPGHEVSTVEEAGFKGLKNGELLNAASAKFDVLVTVDQNLRFQQNLRDVSIAVLILQAPRTTFPFLRPLVPMAIKQLDSMKPGDVIIIS
jgi:hypothetical protein